MTDADQLLTELTKIEDQDNVVKKLEQELGWSNDRVMTCSPKTDPGVMRVYRPRGGKETLDEAQEAQSRADRPQAA